MVFQTNIFLQHLTITTVSGRVYYLYFLCVCVPYNHLSWQTSNWFIRFLFWNLKYTSSCGYEDYRMYLSFVLLFIVEIKQYKLPDPFMRCKFVMYLLSFLLWWLQVFYCCTLYSSLLYSFTIKVDYVLFKVISVRFRFDTKIILWIIWPICWSFIFNQK